MARKVKKIAYVVFRGRIPGLYRTWNECNAQVLGFSNAYQLGYERLEDAERAWAEHVAKQPPIQVHVAASFGIKPLPTEIPDLQYDFDDEELDRPKTLKRSADYIHLTKNDDQPFSKRQRSDINQSDGEGDIMEESKVELTAEQEEVVNLAMKGHNMFLTGAGGSGKTVTLKRILRRFKGRKTIFQVVAPTGIAALPLNGRTIHSFMGWKPNTLRLPMDKLVEEMTPYTKKGIWRAQVLIVEEISMVENQNLERMNLILKAIMGINAPFGGKQVIFLGDFHQLPPVKPFELCVQCGGIMSKVDRGDFMCKEDQCVNRGSTFKEEEKWAFKAPVWKELRLRHIQLQQIHRQKDKQFKDILTNIRKGIPLTPDEWDTLERKKPPHPHGIYPVRLMPRRNQVAEINKAELQAIHRPAKSWNALDSYQKIEPFPQWNKSKPWETDAPLKNHRFPEQLTLKVGAKVVLLHNLDQKRGLVNGSQGVVIGFLREKGVECEPDIRKVEGEPKQGPNNTKRYWDTFSAPVVKFANGAIRPIFAIDSTSQYGTKQMPYVATRVQVPLALAWALTIHKSQGMTLDFIEVSSQDIFERGQFYVALSRGTNIDGVTVTGFSRDQLPLDDDVVEFYRDTKWEVFGTAEPEEEAEVPSDEKEGMLSDDDDDDDDDDEVVGYFIDLQPGSAEKRALLEFQKSLTVSPYF